MRLAFVHYHARPGGVTRVMEHAVAALREGGHELLVLVGPTEALPAWEGATVRVVQGLGYAQEAGAGDSAALGEALLAAAREGFAHGPSPDLWHIHNHSLGKNVGFPGALAQLLEGGARVLLQVHDFAEDGRPENYRRQRAAYGGDGGAWARAVWPDAPYIHYAALNGRDRGFLHAAGVPAERLHLLPNPVAAGSHALPDAPDPKLWPDASAVFLYAVRGIRRKNLGELLLASLLAPEGAQLVQTLPPDNPEWQPIFERWRRFGTRHQLPVTLGAAHSTEASFGDLVARADALITTSVAEGFGLSFLEPWLFGKPLIGRDLPEITADFVEAGVELPGLYARCGVPQAWVDPQALRQRLERALAASYQAYGRSVPAEATAQALESLCDDATDTLDFGRLDEDLQEGVLEAALREPEELRAAAAQRFQLPDAACIERNRARVRRTYALERYAEQLETVYGAVLAAGTGGAAAPRALDTEGLLGCFLDPARLNLLRA